MPSGPATSRDLREMGEQFARRLVHGLDRRAGKLELPAGLERDRAAAGHVGEPDDVLALHDRLPAEQMLHAVEQGADAARPAIGHGPVAVHGEDELLVLGADAEFRFRLAARRKPRDQLVARADRRHVDLVAGHSGVPAKKGRDLNHGNGERAMLTAGGHIRRLEPISTPASPSTGAGG